VTRASSKTRSRSKNLIAGFVRREIDSGIGAAVLPVSIKSQTLASTCPGPSDASWTAISAATT
jgi:hypothetical protein